MELLHVCWWNSVLQKIDINLDPIILEEDKDFYGSLVLDFGILKMSHENTILTKRGRGEEQCCAR